MKTKTFGCRGSAPISHHGYSSYGGNTACMRVQSSDSFLIIDAGSGLMVLEKELRATCPNFPHDLPELNILISHLHLDHIIGLTMFSPVFAPGAKVRIFTLSRDERPMQEQVFGLFAPPYWPVSLKDIALPQCVAISPGVPFSVGSLTVTAFEASHPNQTLSFHVTDGHKNFVHLLDSEIAQMCPDSYAELLDYCREADLVVSDAAYSPQDYPLRKGWGHSTVEDGIRLANDCGCKRMVFAHFGQEYTDADIDSWEELFKNDGRFVLARDGLEMSL